MWGSESQFRVMHSVESALQNTCVLPAMDLLPKETRKARALLVEMASLFGASCSSWAPWVQTALAMSTVLVLCSDSAALSHGGRSSRVPSKLPSLFTGPSEMGAHLCS